MLEKKDLRSDKFACLVDDDRIVVCAVVSTFFPLWAMSSVNATVMNNDPFDLLFHDDVCEVS